MISFTAFHLALKTCSKSCRTIRLTVSWGFLFLFVLEDVSGQINRTSPSLTFRINSGSAIGGGESYLRHLFPSSSTRHRGRTQTASRRPHRPSEPDYRRPARRRCSSRPSKLQRVRMPDSFSTNFILKPPAKSHTPTPPPPHFPTFFYAQIGAERGRLEWR